MSNIPSKQELSPDYDPQRARTNFMAIVGPRKFGDKNWIDPLDPKLLRLLQGRIPYREIIYAKKKPLTTISMEVYMTSSLWWLILMMNGYLHPHDIPDGATLKIPSLTFIQKRMTVVQQTNKGKIVRI